jgi:hypothetical protein
MRVYGRCEFIKETIANAISELRSKKSASEEALDCMLVRYFRFGFRERSLTVMGKYCHVPAGKCQRLKRR